MKIIPTFFHGVFDYLGGVALLFAPEIFGFAEVGGPAVVVARVVGAVVLLQALMTNYELGIFRVLSMRAHLINDYLASAFLLLSPWLFGFQDNPYNVWVPHVAVALSILVVTALTQSVPQFRGYDSKRTAHAH